MRLYGVKPGTCAVVATANRFGYQTALDLLDAGVRVPAVVDMRAEPSGPEVDAVRARGVRIIRSAMPVDSRGRHHVDSVAISRINRADRVQWMACDLVVMAVGYTPALNLASHAGAKVVYDEAINMHKAIDLPPRMSLAGAAGGVWGAQAARNDGHD